MTCPACGKELADPGAFCAFCGARLPAPPAVPYAPQPIPAHAAHLPLPSMSAPAMSGASMSAAGVAARSFLFALGLPEKIGGAGAVFAALGFFLPFFTITKAGSSPGNTWASGDPIPPPVQTTTQRFTYSLLALAGSWGVLYFILLLALASLLLIILARTAARPRKLLIGGTQTLIGAMFGPTCLLSLLFVPAIRASAEPGFWIVSLGYCCIAIGGLMTIARFAKGER